MEMLSMWCSWLNSENANVCIHDYINKYQYSKHSIAYQNFILGLLGFWNFPQKSQTHLLKLLMTTTLLQYTYLLQNYQNVMGVVLQVGIMFGYINFYWKIPHT